MSSITSKRAGGEKRGSKYDRVKRLSALSLADGSAPIVGVTVEGRRRVKGQWIKEPQTLRFRTVNECAHCGCDVYCDPNVRTDERYRAEQDRIDPNGGYTLDNLQLSCGHCNKVKGNRWVG